MSKIKEGEYIRTTQGYIAKVEYAEEDIIMCDSTIFIDYEEAPILVDEQIKLITKHSFNIIDLIEIGDYVNGHKVIQTKSMIKGNLEVEAQGFLGKYFISYEEVKTIVTKEQFNSVMYKVVV